VLGERPDLRLLAPQVKTIASDVQMASVSRDRITAVPDEGTIW